jgi:hypothetical protein
MVSLALHFLFVPTNAYLPASAQHTHTYRAVSFETDGITMDSVHKVRNRSPAFLNSKKQSLQAKKGPGGSRKLSFPPFMTTAQDG